MADTWGGCAEQYIRHQFLLQGQCGFGEGPPASEGVAIIPASHEEYPWVEPCERACDRHNQFQNRQMGLKMSVHTLVEKCQLSIWLASKRDT